MLEPAQTHFRFRSSEVALRISIIAEFPGGTLQGHALERGAVELGLPSEENKFALCRLNKTPCAFERDVYVYE